MPAEKSNVIHIDDNKKSKVLTKNIYSDIKPEELIFALDIGTRTVVGLVGLNKDDLFQVLAAEVVEHRSRAMLDGQIHDITKVAQVALQVKECLEQQIGINLSRVAIAAAGRVLKTCQVKVERSIPEGKEIDSLLINGLEMEGIQNAQMKLEKEILQQDHSQFYCVGYSVVNYYLNDLVISELLGHKGYKIGADILATFLPHVVVDSLYTVMDRIGLEVVSLTLEPIAALNVAIPKDLRLLNLALVDIGAGTSDIAITKNGTVTAYAMASIAGDEITEAIAQNYLVDFNTAEKIKISLSKGIESITFKDILDNEIEVGPKEVQEVIKPVVDELAGTIADRILEYNGKSPNAVFLIGGGSQILGLPEVVAEKLKLQNNRVAVRNKSVARNVIYEGDKLPGPEAITPLGIMITADLQKGQDFFHITVNGKKIKLFHSKKLKVSDALILIGYNPDQLIGKSGKSISCLLNGRKRTLRGEFGKPAEIAVNGKPGNLGTVLKPGDVITVLPAENGKDARASIEDVLKEFGIKKIILNGSEVELKYKAAVNGELAEYSYIIKDGDNINVSKLETLEELIKEYEIASGQFVIYVNGVVEENSYVLQDMDLIECKVKNNIEAGKNKFAKGEYGNLIDGITTGSGENSVENDGSRLGRTVSSNGFTVTVNGKPINLKYGKEYMFVDVFQFIDFDLTRPQGAICLALNGNKAGFTDKIKPGDNISIYWERY